MAGIGKLFKGFGFWVLMVVVWEILARLTGHTGFSDVVVLLVQRLQDGEFLWDIGLSLRRMAVGYFLAIFLGIFGGFLFGKFNWLHETFSTVVVATQAMPGAIWIPLATILCGFSELALIFITVLGGTGIVIVNTDTGVRTVSPIFIQAARVMGARGFRLFKDVIVPAAIPKILDGLRLAWAFAWRALMAGELVLQLGGFGRRINDVVKSRELTELFILILVIGVIGYLVDQIIFRVLERNVEMKWGLNLG